MRMRVRLRLWFNRYIQLSLADLDSFMFVVMGLLMILMYDSMACRSRKKQ